MTRTLSQSRTHQTWRKRERHSFDGFDRARGERNIEIVNVTPSKNLEHQTYNSLAEGKSVAIAGTSKDSNPDGNPKLERHASFRWKFDTPSSGSADLPAAINRDPRPMEHTMSFSKDLRSDKSFKQPYRPYRVQWYNTLSSLAEDERENETSCMVAQNASEGEDDAFEVFGSRLHQVTRVHNLMETNPVRIAVSRFLLRVALQMLELEKKEKKKNTPNAARPL